MDEMYIKIFQYLESSKEFVLSEAPSLAQETLRYHWSLNLISLFASLLVAFSLLSFSIWVYRNPTLESYGARDLFSVFGVVFPSLFSIVAFIICFDSARAFIKIYLAPKLFLIHCFSEIVKG